MRHGSLTEIGGSHRVAHPPRRIVLILSRKEKRSSPPYVRDNRGRAIDVSSSGQGAPCGSIVDEPKRPQLERRKGSGQSTTGPDRVRGNPGVELARGLRAEC